MQFTTLTLSALSVASVLAQSVTVHVVTVASKNNTLAYFPNTVTASKGDMVQFQFAGGNHTVTQSTFDQPCAPIALNSNVTGFYSGFMPVSTTADTTPTYTIQINNTTPIWVYCSQAKHCQAGMVMVINENVAANASRSLAGFKAGAAAAAVNLPGNAVEGGVSATNSSSGTSSGSSTGTSTGSSTKSTSSSAADSLTPVGMGVLALAGLAALL